MSEETPARQVKPLMEQLAQAQVEIEQLEEKLAIEEEARCRFRRTG